MFMIRNNTPVEVYGMNGQPIFVKREDLCAVPPAPPFSKIRGLHAYLKGLKDHGIKTVGYVETAISMAGWGVAWCCQDLGLRCLLFDPQYKNKTPKLLQLHREKWKELGAELIPQQAGRANVNYHRAKKVMPAEAILLPLGLPLRESVNETHKELERTLAFMLPDNRPSSVVVNVGSGTIAAGLLRGLPDNVALYAIMGRTGSIKNKLATIERKAGCVQGGFFGRPAIKMFDPGWEYTKPCREEVPFPCHPYYDAKAWKWLRDNIEQVPEPIMFWNIGSMPEGGL
jgi:1-aminocyclopropane-1-carboxylate deaminase/D-cysteine desulfhydrase-like pyridoxal-dependent ACC family enzyme